MKRTFSILLSDDPEPTQGYGAQLKASVCFLQILIHVDSLLQTLNVRMAADASRFFSLNGRKMFSKWIYLKKLAIFFHPDWIDDWKVTKTWNCFTCLPRHGKERMVATDLPSLGICFFFNQNGFPRPSCDVLGQSVIYFLPWFQLCTTVGL